MDTTTNSSEMTENITKLNDLKKYLYKEIYSHENEIARIKKRINQIENNLMAMCGHQWEYEDYCGMYDKPDQVCKLCKSRIYGF